MQLGDAEAHPTRCCSSPWGRPCWGDAIMSSSGPGKTEDLQAGQEPSAKWSHGSNHGGCRSPATIACASAEEHPRNKSHWRLPRPVDRWQPGPAKTRASCHKSNSRPSPLQGRSWLIINHQIITIYYYCMLIRLVFHDTAISFPGMWSWKIKSPRKIGMIQTHATRFSTALVRLQKLSSRHDFVKHQAGFLKLPPAHQKVPPECVLPRGAGENVYIRPLWCGLVRCAISSATIFMGHFRDARDPCHVPMQLICNNMIHTICTYKIDRWSIYIISVDFYISISSSICSITGFPEF